ncbi:MAG: TraB/GumN family protein [Gemmatimonadota bacterium]|nr:TraB/GumN family protein [Gemmatimonadota bacterium]
MMFSWISHYLKISLYLIVLLQASPSEAQKHTLWKVESPSNTVYLLGSLHMLKPGHYPLPKAMEDAFADSRHLVTETNMDELETPEIRDKIMAKAIYMDGSTLKSSLSLKAYETAEKTLRELQSVGLSLKIFERFKPWFVATSIVGLKLQQLGFDPANGVDWYFFNKAKAATMALHALETSDFQINLLSSMSKKNQELMLLQTLRDLEITEELFVDFYEAWEVGDTAGLDQLLTESFKEYPAVYSKLIIARNQNWLPQIEKYLAQDENYLVVVGAGHLVGDQSVVRMLQVKGYSVQQQ